MQQNQAFIAEIKMEAANTRKMLERVPVEKNDFKPHEKSMTLGRLASHVAELYFKRHSLVHFHHQKIGISV